LFNVREKLEELQNGHGRELRVGTRFHLDGRGREFAEFVLQGKRFTCVNGLNSKRARDISSSFVRLKTGEFCRVEKGFELGGQISENSSLRWLAVVPYRVRRAALLARHLTLLDNDESTHGPLRWVSVKDISSAAISLLQPIGATAESSQTTRIVIPVSDF